MPWLPSFLFELAVLSRDMRAAARAPTVLRRLSPSASAADEGDTTCCTDVLTSSAFEDVVDIVRFRKPLSADMDIVDGREKVTLVERIDTLESCLARGKGLSSPVEIAVVAVAIDGNIGFEDPRTVDIDAKAGLWRLLLALAAWLPLRGKGDSEGRLGKGDGTDRGGRVRERPRVVELRVIGVGDGSWLIVGST